PLTGRTNQLRIHFKQLGHPILGDDRFAFRRDFNVKSKKLCLHAQELEFIHPVTHKTVSLACVLPPRMQELLGAII
ncbi:MAG: 23S rRNA pseudouridine(955/2504/2580) synthase, partial [Candidatus Omnitrophica bacterium]|nr:23S rRNA pseudouridine(955/2504/2580) synthase [Candidatus Omnitrophota bacterium]